MIVYKRRKEKNAAPAVCFFTVMLICAQFVLGCASSPAVADTSQSAIALVDMQKNEKKTDTVTSWKNRGFGETRPDWLSMALSGDFTALKNKYPDVTLRDIFLVQAKGSNLDYIESRVDTYVVPAKYVQTDVLSPITETWIKIHPADASVADFYIAAKLYVAAGMKSGDTPRCIVIDIDQQL